MNRTRLMILVGLAVAGVCCGGLWAMHARSRAAWISACPRPPDLGECLPSFQARVASVEGRLAAWPPDVEALGELARLYHANGFLAEAETAYRALVRYDPRNPAWPHLLGVLLAGFGRMDEAVPLFRRAIQLDPTDLAVRLHLADSLLKSNDMAGAGAAYQDLLDRSPGNPYAMLGVARVELAGERRGASLKTLRALVAANPDFYGAHDLLASLDEQFGADQEAAVEREKAGKGRFREAPDPVFDSLMNDCYDPYRLQVMAATAMAVQAYPEAMPPLQRALALKPDDSRTHRQLGLVYLKMADYARSREQLERAVALDPKNDGAIFDLVSAYQDMGEKTAALRTLAAAVKIIPESPGLHYDYGMALVDAGRIPEAITQLEAAESLNPENHGAAEELARIRPR
jgi:tetratricopeptide (TPR) repeat protein